ncbi:hypothetical protein [Mannheimia indoligenes]|uniref:hypothetical protein n=1 Tax=Mannheimia indoligenes TaxID=3103145 RepID=UPI002FE67194
MKQDYAVFWSKKAEFKLLDKADYIYSESQNEEIMRSLAEKLSFVASAYADGKFHLYPFNMDIR